MLGTVNTLELIGVCSATKTHPIERALPAAASSQISK